MIKSIKAYCLVQLMFEGNSNAILTAQLFGSPPTTLDLDGWSIRPCISHIWTTRSWMQTTVRYRTAMKGPQISFPNHLELFVIYLKKYIHNSSIIAFELLSIATSNCGNTPQKMLIHSVSCIPTMHTRGKFVNDSCIPDNYGLHCCCGLQPQHGEGAEGGTGYVILNLQPHACQGLRSCKGFDGKNNSEGILSERQFIILFSRFSYQPNRS